MRKKLLRISVVLLLLIGLGFSLVPFIVSQLPNDRADAAAPYFELPDLEAGEYKVIPHPGWQDDFLEKQFPNKNFEWSLFIYKKLNGELRVWVLITDNAKVGMPYSFWWQPIGLCNDFGPTHVSGKVDEQLPIRCHDTRESTGEYIFSYTWNIDGRSLNTGYIRDMIRVDVEKEHKGFRIVGYQ